MAPIKVVVQRNIRTVVVKTNGVKWQSGGGSAVTSDNVSAAIDGFTVESNPQKTQYVALGSKKKSLISALIALWKGDFDTYYAAIGHNHNSSYSAINHNHDSSYSALGHNHSGTYQPVGDYATNTALANKVDKETGKGLSQENYTTAEKSKLAGLDDNHWKGKFTSEALLNAVTGVSGDYAAVDLGVGFDVVGYIWDSNDNKWVKQLGVSMSETAASVKSKYESNPDTNAFTDTLKAKLVAFTANFTSELKTAYDSVVTWISTNGTNLLNHLSNTSNPHNVTTSQIGAPSGSGNSTGTNTGDETATTIKSKLGISTLSGSNTGDETAQSIGNLIAGATNETTPADDDYFAMSDTSVSGILQKLSYATLKSILKTYFNTYYQAVGSYLTAVNHDNSLVGNGAGTNLGMASMFDRARLVGLQYVEDFAIADGTTFINQWKGFYGVSVNSGTYTISSNKLVATSGASTNSGYAILFSGTHTSNIAKTLSYYNRIEALIQITAASTTNKIARVGFGASISAVPLVDGVTIEFNAGNIYAKTTKSSTEITVATLVTGYSLNTWYRCVVDVSNPASVNFYVYNSSGTLLGSANATANLPTTILAAFSSLINTTNSAGTLIGEIRLVGVTLAPINL